MEIKSKINKTNNPKNKKSWNSWPPGVLCDKQIQEFIKAEHIQRHDYMDWRNLEIEDSYIQPATLDLSLGNKVHEIKSSFVHSGQKGCWETLDKNLIYKTQSLTNDGLTLEVGKIYAIEIAEKINQLPLWCEGHVNPKSSSGRLDLFCRVLGDGQDQFDRLPPGFDGRMILIVKPQSFSVIVRPTTALVQLRLRKIASGPVLSPPPAFSTMRRSQDGMNTLARIHLKRESSNEAGFYTAKLQTENTIPAIDMEHHIHTIKEDRRLLASDFFEEHQSKDEMTLYPDKFYIMSTLDAIEVPYDMACEMIPFDEGIGEFRTQFAGFFDPGFGMDETCEGVLEIRARDMPFILRHGQVVCRMRYEPMSQMPSKPYKGNYTGQKLSLSKHFKVEKDPSKI